MALVRGRRWFTDPDFVELLNRGDEPYENLMAVVNVDGQHVKMIFDRKDIATILFGEGDV